MTASPPNSPDPSAPATIQQSTGYQLRKIREGHYVKVVDGEIVGKASLGDVYIYHNQKTAIPVEAGAVEVALAFTTILALLFSLSWSIADDRPWLFVVFVSFKFILGLLYFVSYLATTLLLARHIAPKLPITATEFFSTTRRSPNPIWQMPGIYFWWLIFHLPRLVILFILGRVVYWLRSRRSFSLGRRMRGIGKLVTQRTDFEVELAYLTLLVTFGLAGLAIPIYITIQLVFDLVPHF